MTDKKFISVLKKAIADDESAICEIIQFYENLIIKNSFVNGKIDEDCRAYIESELITKIKKFKI